MEDKVILEIKLDIEAIKKDMDEVKAAVINSFVSINLSDIKEFNGYGYV